MAGIFPHKGQADGTQVPGQTQNQIASRTAGEKKHRRRVPQLRREELLEAAFRALQRLGPEKCRVADVTREAGAAKGTFYLYFTGWQDMVGALRRQIMERYGAEFKARLANTGRLDWAGFEAEALRFVHFIVLLGPLHRAIFHGPGRSEALSPGADTQKLIGGFLEQGMASGAVRRVDAASVAPLLFSVLHTSADCIAGQDQDGPALESLRQLLRRWLAPPVNG